ncbi:hypothetical protein HMPREF9976_05971 [Staphylococcus epidermidis NIHLM003]|nr:hypothetical protein HMPREF9994_02359 [Staphylococcus epidermidis NIHLM088]EJE23162.1 hypothetical protein HMPREF9976_05971 [Staphylococcus epidermidis NIHLM003]
MVTKIKLAMTNEINDLHMMPPPPLIADSINYFLISI